MPDQAADVTSVKIVVGGGPGVGKTTFVNSLSEVMPLTTEAVMTMASAEVDDPSHPPAGDGVPLAIDFGRLTLARDLVLYVFGMPEQHQFWPMWDELTQGAVGAVLLVDAYRIADSFPARDFFEASGLPFIVAVIPHHGQFPHRPGDVRQALKIGPDVPVIPCDVRNRESAQSTILLLVERAMSATNDNSHTGPGILLRG